jgi:two-component system sensor histidine kinase KdpD
LAITKAIVEVHGGSVTVANRPSGGACFVIDLPVEIQPEIPPEADAK